MKHARKVILAGSAFLCATSLSFGWSDHGGLSLSVASAQARAGRPATPVSVAGVTRRHVRRGGAYVGAGLAGAAAVGTAAVIGSAYNGYYGGRPYYRGAGYGYAAGPYDAYAADAAPYGGYVAVPYGAYVPVPFGIGAYGYGDCAPGPRVGAFATQPWTDMPTCPPY
jgi:hypothetical protein